MKFRKRDYLVIGMIVFIGILLFITNLWRADAGWFEDGAIIFYHEFLYVIFFGLISGYVIAKIIGNHGK
jgi:hypothetical protein